MRKIRPFGAAHGLDGPGKSLYNSQYRKAEMQGAWGGVPHGMQTPVQGRGLNFETRCSYVYHSNRNA